MRYQINQNDRAVSGVVGEMLMIGIVLIIAGVFTASLADYLPSERNPSVTIIMNNDTGGNFTLWHKGGDWVKAETIRVIVSNATDRTTYTLTSEVPFIIVPDTQAYDLDSNITVTRNSPFLGDEQVDLATDRAVIFSGTIRRSII